MDDIHTADAILVATHSQGSIVSTHLLDRLIHDKHIRTTRSVTTTIDAAEALARGGVNAVPSVQSIPIAPQKICMLALCGIHLGPLRYLSSSSLLQPYIQVRHTVVLELRGLFSKHSFRSISNLLPLRSCSNSRCVLFSVYLFDFLFRHKRTPIVVFLRTMSMHCVTS
jgi:hypothetical protein